MKIDDLITETGIGYSDGWEVFSKDAIATIGTDSPKTVKQITDLYNWSSEKFDSSGNFEQFKEDWATWVAEADGDVHEALSEFLNFYYDTYYVQHRGSMGVASDIINFQSMLYGVAEQPTDLTLWGISVRCRVSCLFSEEE